jgi:hypothetical protein
MPRRSVFYAALATLVMGTIGLLPLAAAGASGSSPHIVAKPDNVMVNTTTLLYGRNFAPSTSLTVKECGAKNWIVPQNPCDSTNSVTVTTDKQGRFKSSFKVQTCPSGASTPPGFSEKCYIGVPKPNGVDTIALVGATGITVTGP